MDYKFRCEKCGSINTETETKGTQTGLYCCDCGKWIRWLNKEEVRIFNNSNVTNYNSDYTKQNKGLKKCVVIETDFADSFENKINEYLSQGYNVEFSSCNSKLYKAILVLVED